MAFAGDGVDGRSPEQTAVALVAAARGYHRREDKPFWWAHFDRLNNPVDEWGDTSDVFLAETAEVVEDWHLPSSRARKQQRWVKLTGTLAAGGLGQQVFALYEPPAPAGLADNPDRRAAGNAEITDVDDPNVPTEVIDLRARAQGGRDVRAVAVRADAGQRPSRRRSCASPSTPRQPRSRAGPARACPTPRSSTSCCAAPRAPAAAHRCRTPATPPRTSPPHCSTSTPHTSRCTARPAPARRSRRPGSSPGW